MTMPRDWRQLSRVVIGDGEEPQSFREYCERDAQYSARSWAGFGPAGIMSPASGGLVPEEELIQWFVTHGWRQSKSELVARLLQDFVVTRRTP